MMFAITVNVALSTHNSPQDHVALSNHNLVLAQWTLSTHNSPQNPLKIKANGKIYEKNEKKNNLVKIAEVMWKFV